MELSRLRIFLTVVFEKGSSRAAYTLTHSQRAIRRAIHRAKEVPLWLSRIAHHLGNLWQRLALPKRIEKWSLTRLQQRLVKAGGSWMEHTRCYGRRLAECHPVRHLFGAMMQRIAPMPLAAGQNLAVAGQDSTSRGEGNGEVSDKIDPQGGGSTSQNSRQGSLSRRPRKKPRLPQLDARQAGVYLAPPAYPIGSPRRGASPATSVGTPFPSARHYAPPQEVPAGTADSLDLMAFARMLYTRKWLVVLLALVGILLAVAVSLVQPRMYQSVAVLEIQPANEDFLDLRDINPTATPPSYSDEPYIQTQAEILRQDWLIERAVSKTNLDRRPEFTPKPGWWSRLQEVAGLPPSPLPPAKKYAIQLVKDNLKVVPSRGSRVIHIVYEDPDPQLAAGFANTLAKAFIEQSVEARWNAAQEVQEWLRPQLENLKAKLQQSEAKLRSYVVASGLQVTSGQENLAEDKLRLLQGELSKAQADRVAKQSVYYSALEGQPEVVARDPEIQEYRLRLTDLRRQFADLNTLLKPENYKMVSLNAQIAEVDAALQRELSNNRKRLQEDYEAARDRESLLQQAYDNQWGLISNISSKMVHYNTLKHEVETTRQFYEAMMLKANEAGIASVIRPSNIRFVSPAEPPLRLHRPNLPLNAGLGGLLGLLLGIGLVTMKDYKLRRLRVPGDAQVYLSLPELGAIPSARPSRLQKLLGAEAIQGSLELASWEQNLSALSESFRGTVDSILLNAFNGSVPRVMVVTSPLPREGKTVVVSNLGITLAAINRRVLLIDGDLRRPRLHKIFGLTNQRGLSSLLLETDAVLDLPLEALVRTTNVPNLSVLLSGPGTECIASLLYSPAMEKLMGRFREEFDHVLIDTPPSLPFTDARLLARYADGVVLVLRANQTNDKTALLAVQRFLMAGVPVLGTILNAWDPPELRS